MPEGIGSFRYAEPLARTLRYRGFGTVIPFRAAELEEVPGLTSQLPAYRIECRETYGPRLVLLEDGEIRYRYTDALAQLRERHLPFDEQHIEIDRYAHDTILLHGTMYPARKTRIEVIIVSIMIRPP